MKRDVLIALAVIALIFALTFALTSIRPPFQPTKSKPFALDLSHAKEPAERVVMRVNGTAVTEREFEEAFHALPEETQRQFANVAGKQAFAEQYVRLKLLAQEGEKMGVDNQPEVRSQLIAERTNVLAGAALMKLVQQPTEEAARRWYEQNKQHFTSVELSHIVVAYEGGAIPPRDGGKALSEQAAAQKAVEISMKARNGADFAQLAQQFSDDTNSAQLGGKLGPVTPGMLPQEIEAQVFRLAPGQVSGPIPSRYGIHVFKLGPRETRTYEQVKRLVMRQLQQQNAVDRVEVLRKAANVEFDPKFFPDAKSWGKTGTPKNPS